MFRVLRQSQSIGIVTETIDKDDDYSALGQQIKRALLQQFHGSIAIRHVDAGSCNACELEIHAINNPYYSAERFGVHFVASPRHADILLVTGPVTRHMQAALRRTYEAMSEPRWVIASGACAAGHGPFAGSYACVGRVADVIPVDMTIDGCPPTPLQLLKGLLALLDSAKRAS